MNRRFKLRVMNRNIYNNQSNASNQGMNNRYLPVLTAAVAGVLLEIENKGLVINSQEAIPFNIEANNTDRRYIRFNRENGSVRLLKPGLYTIDWWLGIEGTNSADQIQIDIDVKEIDGERRYYSTTHPVIITGLAYGQNLINIYYPSEIRLVNNSQYSISLTNNTNMQGSIRIIGYIGECR